VKKKKVDVGRRGQWLRGEGRGVGRVGGKTSGGRIE
jgi:hypothetical protein